MADDDSGKNAGSHWKRRAVEQKIAENEAQLTAARQAVQAFEEKAYELKELLNSTSPIMSSLPLDILSEIFIVLARDEASAFLPLQLLIGRICRAWRRIAWSTPRLWGDVCLELSKNRWETQKHLLQDWIKRGGSSPLELRFSISYDHRDWEPPSDVFQPIMASCHRWTKLSCIRAFKGLASVLGQKEHEFPLLNSIEILHVGKATVSQRHLTEWNFHSATPHLRRLYLPGFTPGPSLGVNWACLAYLSIAFEFGSEKFSEILSLVCSLETLHCTVYGGPNHPANLQLPIYLLSHLGNIRVDGTTNVVMLLLGSITTPVLKDLHLDMNGRDSSLHWTTTIVELARRSSCNLADIFIRQNNLTDEGPVLDLLRQISPSVETFRLECFSSSFTLSNLTLDYINLALPRSDGRHEEYLPKLESFTYFGEVSFTLKAMSRMLKSRMPRSTIHVALDSKGSSLGADIPQLESEAMGSSSTVSFPQKFSVSINYSNVEWFQAKHPNDIRKFFQGVALLAADGVDLELECIDGTFDYEEDYSEEDESE